MSTVHTNMVAALKALLINSVTAVSGRVYLLWDDQPDVEHAPYLQIAFEDATIDPDVIIGQWEHTVPVKIAALKTGKFDYIGTWDLLNSVSASINSNPNLSGLVSRIEITGKGDHITIAGDKILWPHLTGVIVYRTTKGLL